MNSGILCKYFAIAIERITIRFLFIEGLRWASGIVFGMLFLCFSIFRGTFLKIPAAHPRPQKSKLTTHHPDNIKQYDCTL